MISRIVQITVQPEKIREFKSVLNEEYLPKIQAQPGFVENLEALDTNTGRFCCITVWQTPMDEQRYGQGLFQEISRKLMPLAKTTPTVDTLPIENSSALKIHAGKAGQSARLSA